MKDTKYFKIDFDRTITVDYLKSQWRKIAVSLHPDKGGSEEEFKMAMDEYDYLLNYVGATYTANQDSPDAYTSWNDFLASVAEHVAECYKIVYNIPNVTDIEICGQWIWVGITFEQKAEREALKAINVKNIKFKFSRNKKRWYWAGRRSYNRNGSCDMETIRAIYGSKRMPKEEQAKITA